MKENRNSLIKYLLCAMTAASLAGCAAEKTPEPAASPSYDTGGQTQETDPVIQTLYDADELFTERDLEQTPDLSGAERCTLENGQTVTLSEAGVYVFSGSAENAQIRVDAGKEDKVQIVLDSVSVTNRDIPVIYVIQADKVFVTMTDSENTMSVTGNFRDDGTEETDAVIYSKEDLVLNGTGSLKISSTENGIVSKDGIRVTGGTYTVSAEDDGIEANDFICVADGTINITDGEDGLHAENEDDDTLGFIYIGGGSVTVRVEDDCIHGESSVQIDGGRIELYGAEGIESTRVQINGGTLLIEARDDGINAGRKSHAYTPYIEINDGEITISAEGMEADGLDSNGDLVIRGGTVDITSRLPYDVVGTLTHTGGTVIINGQKTEKLTK